MGDIPATHLLGIELTKIKSIPGVPRELSKSMEYMTSTDTVISECSSTIDKVNTYAKSIQECAGECQESVDMHILNIQDAIKTILDNVNVSRSSVETETRTSARTEMRSRNEVWIEDGSTTRGGIRTGFSRDATNYEGKKSHGTKESLRCVQDLQTVNKSMLRLKEFMSHVEIAIAKVQENGDLTIDDINTFNAYLDSWKQERDTKELKQQKKRIRDEHECRRREAERKEEQARLKREEEAKRIEEEKEKIRKKQEQEKRMEEERLRKETEEKRKKEEEERRKREIQEQLQQEAEERREKERLRKEEDRRRKREEIERLKKEEQERLQMEEEERRQRDKEERRQRKAKEARIRELKRKKLEEERQKKDEEERLRKEEQERAIREEMDRKKRRDEEIKLQQLEEERRKREEENERQRKLEEERIRREEEERKKRQEERRRRREQEKQRREEERKEKERKEREEAEKKWRSDPNNWNNILHYRKDSQVDRVDGDRQYHKNVCCVVSTPPSLSDQPGDSEHELECLASDEVDDLITILDDGEKIASSVISINSKSGKVASEPPVRVFIPHCRIIDTDDELIVKVSIDGRDWVSSTSFRPVQALHTEHDINLLGTELDAFENAKIATFVRRRSQTIIIDQPGINIKSNYDKNIRLFVPRDAVPRPTELKLSIKPIAEDDLTKIKQIRPECEDATLAGPLITLSCQTSLDKNIEVDFIKSSQQSITTGTYHACRTSDNVWQFADKELKGRTQDVSVKLPAFKSTWCLMPVGLPASEPKEAVLKIAQTISELSYMSVVRIVVRQKSENPAMGIIHCVKRELVPSRLAELDSLGYTLGADTSGDVFLTEGQNIMIGCLGNIGMANGQNGTISIPFFAYMDTAKENVVFHVKDKYKQKDLPHYIGKVVCTVHQLAGTGDDGNQHELKIELPVTLPKMAEPTKHQLKTAVVKLPYYLSSLARFLSWKLTDSRDKTWFNVLEKLGARQTMKTIYRGAKLRVGDVDDEKVLCHAVLLDWMKRTEVQKDKVALIEKALEQSDLSDLKNECHNFVRYQKEYMTDGTMAMIAMKVHGDPKHIGSELGLDEVLVTKILQDNDGDVSDQIEALLLEWRQSDAAVQVGVEAMEHLKELLNI